VKGEKQIVKPASDPPATVYPLRNKQSYSTKEFLDRQAIHSYQTTNNDEEWLITVLIS
jgi:hypothetical protein